jgi:hypothetical protein
MVWKYSILIAYPLSLWLFSRHFKAFPHRFGNRFQTGAAGLLRAKRPMGPNPGAASAMQISDGQAKKRINIIPYSGPTEIFCIGLGPDELLCESLEAASREKDIRFGAILSGIGALKRATLHHIEHTRFPPHDLVQTIDKPLELLSIKVLKG